MESLAVLLTSSTCPRVRSLALSCKVVDQDVTVILALQRAIRRLLRAVKALPQACLPLSRFLLSLIGHLDFLSILINVSKAFPLLVPHLHEEFCSIYRMPHDGGSRPHY